MTRYCGVMGRNEYTAVAALPRSCDLDHVRRWMALHPNGYRQAISKIGNAPTLAKRPAEELGDARRWFGITDRIHPFACETPQWLSLTETQVMAGIKHYLNMGPPARTIVFMKAAAPWMAWPATLSQIEILTEVPTGKGGRIDLLVMGVSDGCAWGLAVEAKFGASLAHNPLSHYRECASKSLGRKAIGAGFANSTRLALIVAAPKKQSIIKSRLTWNKDWRFMAWSTLLARFERLLDQTDKDAEFAHFRKQIWDCL